MAVFSARSLAALEAGSGDITVVAADGREVKAHSFVLCHSPVIEAALTGDMQQADSGRVTIDCRYETAKAFLKFLYTGCLLADSVTSFDVMVDLIRVADAYAVANELSTACSSGEGQAVVSAVLDSVTWQIADPAIVRSLQQLCQIHCQHACELLKQCIERIDPQIGSSMFEWLCFFEAMGALEACMQVLKTKNRILLSRDGTWLEQEISKENILHLLSYHRNRPSVLLVAVSAYFKVIVGATPSGIAPAKPKIGELVQTDSGRCGVLIEIREEPEPPISGVFEVPPRPPPYRIQFGNVCEWVRDCHGLHEHTMVLKRFPQVVKIVTDCVLSYEKS